jgi:hypothetical protein
MICPISRFSQDDQANYELFGIEHGKSSHDPLFIAVVAL